MGIVHLPVMLREVIEFFGPREDGVYVDATVGLGGHAEGILGRLGPRGVIIGIDRDENALKEAGERLADGRCILRKARFSEVDEVARGLGFEKVDGVLFDFGASMLQMRDADRGFGFGSDAPLDMRMDRSERLTAGEIVNTYPEPEIEKILREYGEERKARKIARAIVRKRQGARIETCRELAGLIAAVTAWRGKIHPATRTFQALRVAVNDEIGEIRKALAVSVGVLAPGGRLITISYHSLEDRESKTFMRGSKSAGILKILTAKPLTAGREELRGNPSARSAKMRVAEVL